MTHERVKLGAGHRERVERVKARVNKGASILLNLGGEIIVGFGGAVKLTGESEYRRALKSTTDNLTVLSSEMKVVNSLYDKSGNKIYWADGDVFRTNKFVANDEVTIGGKIRILPIKTGTHNGIGFVEVYTGE